MSKISKFEDLIAWQKARVLTRQVYAVTRTLPFAKDYGLSNQIQRASASIMANIAEGFERNRMKEFHQFLSVSKSSCAEVRSHLYVAYDAGYISEPHFEELQSLASEVGRIIGGLRREVEKEIS